MDGGKKRTSSAYSKTENAECSVKKITDNNCAKKKKSSAGAPSIKKCKCKDKGKNWTDFHFSNVSKAKDLEKNKDKEEKKKTDAQDGHNRTAPNIFQEDTSPQRKLERIVSATAVSGELVFLVMWEGVLEPSFITAREAVTICPVLVLDYFHEHLDWMVSIDDTETTLD